MALGIALPQKLCLTLKEECGVPGVIGLSTSAADGIVDGQFTCQVQNPSCATGSLLDNTSSFAVQGDVNSGDLEQIAEANHAPTRSEDPNKALFCISPPFNPLNPELHNLEPHQFTARSFDDPWFGTWSSENKYDVNAKPFKLTKAPDWQTYDVAVVNDCCGVNAEELRADLNREEMYDGVVPPVGAWRSLSSRPLADTFACGFSFKEANLALRARAKTEALLKDSTACATEGEHRMFIAFLRTIREEACLGRSCTFLSLTSLLLVCAGI